LSEVPPIRKLLKTWKWWNNGNPKDKTIRNVVIAWQNLPLVNITHDIVSTGLAMDKLKIKPNP
jgi:hypothetical protein